MKGKRRMKTKLKTKMRIRRFLSMLLMLCMLVTIPTSCKSKKGDETTSEATTIVSQTTQETETFVDQKPKTIDFNKYKLKDDKSIFEITKLVKKSNKNKNDKLVAACAMSYRMGDSRVLRLLYSRAKGGVVKQYVVKEFLLDANEMAAEEYKFSVKDGGGKGGLNVISLEDMVFSDDTNKRIYAPDYCDKPISYSKVSGGEVFVYNGKPYVFGNTKMEFYEVTKKGKVSYNFKLNERYSSARLLTYNKLKFVQVEAISPYETKKIYMDIDPDIGVDNKYTMDKFDEYFEEYGEDRYYELTYDKNNKPGIYLYDKKANIRIRKSLPKSITKLCNGSTKVVDVANDAIADDNMLLSVKNNGVISNLYLWNLKKGKTQKYEFAAKNPFEFTEKKLTKDGLRKKANELEEKYGVLIYFGDDAKTDFGSYAISKCTDRGQIESGLRSLEQTLSMYPDKFFEQINYGSVEKTKIHLVGNISGTGAPNTVARAAAFTGVVGNTQYVVIDITLVMQKATLAHEFTHMIDRKLTYEGVLDEAEWNKLNPNGFSYRNRYVDVDGGNAFDSISSEYTYVAAMYGEEQMSNVYFYDDYAKTYATEDRAEMMECLMSDGYAQEKYLKCKHVMKKLHKYAELIDECFDTTGWGTTLWEQRIDELSGGQAAA